MHHVLEKVLGQQGMRGRVRVTLGIQGRRPLCHSSSPVSKVTPEGGMPVLGVMLMLAPIKRRLLQPEPGTNWGWSFFFLHPPLSYLLYLLTIEIYIYIYKIYTIYLQFLKPAISFLLCLHSETTPYSAQGSLLVLYSGITPSEFGG